MGNELGIENIDAFNDYMNVQRPSTFGETLGAAYELSKRHTPLNSTERIAQISGLKSGAAEIGTDKVSANDLNKQFPGLPEPFKDDQYPQVAEEIADRQQKDLDLQRKIALGPQGAFYDVTKLGAMLIPHAIDPINIGAGILTAGAFNAAFASAKFAKLAPVFGVSARAATAGQLFARGAAEGVASNLVVEPFALAAAGQDGADYSVRDAFVGAVGGSIGFAGLRYGAGKLRHGLNKSVSFVKNLSPKHSEIVQTSAIAQLELGKSVDVDPIIKDFTLETNGRHDGGVGLHPRQRYDFTPIVGNDYKGRAFYGSAEKPSSITLDSPSHIIGEDLGDGLYFSENANVANGTVARKADVGGGTIRQVELGEVKLLDLDAPTPLEARAILKRFANLADDEMEAFSLRDIIDEVKGRVANGDLAEEAIEEMNGELSKVGFDGYRSEGGDLNGHAHDKHNTAMLFNDSKIKEVERFKADTKAVPRQSMEDVKKLAELEQSPERKVFFDKKELEALKKDIESPSKDPLFAETKKAEEEIIEELAESKKMGLLDPDDVKEFELLKAAQKDAELQNKLIKAAGFCLRRNG